MKSITIRQPHGASSHRGYLWLSLVVAASGLRTSVGHASEASTAAALSGPLPTSIEITAQAIDDDHLPQGATSLGKLPLKAREIPQSVSVINRGRIEQQNMRSLDDVMAQSTGVTSTPFITSRTAYYVRGFQVNSFEMDGVPVLLSEIGSAPEDMAAFERVEVLRGANGLLHGSGNPAATINMVRKHAPYDYQTNIKLEAGSWNRYRGELDVGGPLNHSGSVRGRAVMAWEDGDYFYDRAKHRSQVLYGTVDADLTDDTTLRVGAERHTIHSNPNIGGLPMSSDSQDLHLARHTNLDANWTYLNYYTTRFFAGLDHHFSDTWQGKLNMDYQDAETDNYYGVLFGNVDAQSGEGDGVAIASANKLKNHHLGVDASVVGQLQGFGHTHHVIFGASVTDAVTKQELATPTSDFYYPVNIYHWDPTSISAPALGAYTSPGSSTSIQKGLYGMGRIKLADPLTLVVGARESWWQARTPTAATNAQAKLTPYGGVIWDFAHNWSWYGSYATVWQPQTYLTYDGGLLSPMKGDTWETGVKTSLNDGAVDLSLAVFKIDLQNTPMADTRHIDTSTNYYVNGGDASSKGIELETSGHLTPRWEMSAGYTWVKAGDAKSLTEGAGTPYGAGAPRHILRLWSNYELPWDQQRWSIGGGVQAQSHSSSDYDATLHQGGYLLANMRVGYRINDHWTAAINGNNIFDRRYYSGLFMHQYANRYGDPRNVSVSLTGHF